MKNFICSVFITIIISCTGKEYLSPGAVAVDTEKKTAYTLLTTAKSIAVTDLESNETLQKIKLNNNPDGILISPDGSVLYVSCGKAKGEVKIIALPEKKITATVETGGHTPQGMALSVDGQKLYVANRFSNNVAVIDLTQNKVISEITTVREPRSICISSDGKTLAVANFLPAQSSCDSAVAAQITLINLPDNTVRKNIVLENGAQSVSGLCYSHDGNYLYACHLISQYDIPVTQLDRGWVNTNALSIIDAVGDSLYATVLLDDVDKGAANPAGICVGNNKKIYIAASGTHELIIIDEKIMHEKLSAFFAGKIEDKYIRNSSDLSSSLTFASSFKKRFTLQGLSPRSVAFAGNCIILSSRFSTFLEKFDLDGNPLATVQLGKEPAPDAIRRGELAFCDASICYQGWQSCVSCHPDARADGLNWDQQNDGLGNPKNTKSLLFSHVTPPCMITGIRKNAEIAVRNGILHTLQTVQSEEFANDMDKYLKSLEPEESPYLAEYLKKDVTGKGKAIFERARCAECHNGSYYTDLKKYDVGSGENEEKNTLFDTPTLREVWRTSPYLYNGKAVSLREVLTVCNPENLHGITQNLTEEELQALILYILTL
ncbi:MAG: beta-propeller fold lactonase family protein [Prevotellaceae bacterium]|jgi:YVTN family beta-propeller protein|nr:beta-propeller fold lactonase family protein [Prevotellaceae bacterium]